MTELTIRPVADVAEYEAIQRVQRQTWGFGPEDPVLHLPLMVAMQHYGGLVLGAFAADALVGFALAFIGRDADRYFFYSQIVGALPEWQSRGVGLALKAAQREHALAQGYGLMRWTFDPLATRNAHFNFGKLGGVARAYAPNMYGSGRGALFGATATDRLIVDWELGSARVVQRLAGAQKPREENRQDAKDEKNPQLALTAVRAADGSWQPGAPDLTLSAEWVGVQVPAQRSGTATGDHRRVAAGEPDGADALPRGGLCGT